MHGAVYLFVLSNIENWMYYSAFARRIVDETSVITAAAFFIYGLDTIK
jgi:hypothetical protein